VQAFILRGIFTQKKQYYENGKLMYEGEWQDGKRHGQGKGYDENGTLMHEGAWQDGKRRG